MADSNITKRALASALKKLMEDTPFEKISVANICGLCGMSRKSFYYHFKDKYDLVNWIFDNEFIDSVNGPSEDDRWGFIEQICGYFYENRGFYRKALEIKGQNSFSDHLWEYIFPIMKNRVDSLVGDDAADDFTVSFFTDASISAMERWLKDKNCMPTEEFVAKLKYIILKGSAAIYRENESDM